MQLTQGKTIRLQTVIEGGSREFLSKLTNFIPKNREKWWGFTVFKSFVSGQWFFFTQGEPFVTVDFSESLCVREQALIFIMSTEKVHVNFHVDCVSFITRDF